ncbi:MAG TPA: hypothetical protein VFS30_07950 [Dehalococcoidia bacterium]|nr:hypothetical protein [Dehalococcoidia bacterium]
MEIIRPSGYTHVEVEANDNTPMMAQQVYKNLGLPFRVTQVRIYEGELEGMLHDIAGWSSAGDGTPVAAYAVHIEDSSAGAAYLVYGGDWGVRLRPADSEEPWSMEDAAQFGETHLVLASDEDLTRA